jgi:hypothetical protein
MGPVYRRRSARSGRRYDKFLGVVQKRYGEKKEEVERWAEDWHERNEILARKATESPNQK